MNKVASSEKWAHYFRNFEVYGSLANFSMFGGTALLLFIVLGFGVNKMYQAIDHELRHAEGTLEEIDMFEGFTGWFIVESL